MQGALRPGPVYERLHPLPLLWRRDGGAFADHQALALLASVQEREHPV